jgi:putative membrane protein
MSGDATAPGRVRTSQLRRLHPLTPLLRSWQLAGVMTAVLLALLGDDPDRWVWTWNAINGEADFPLLFKASIAIVGVGSILLAVGWVSWRMTGFALVADRRTDDESEPIGTLLYHRGVLVRQRSRVRLDRVQSVDVLQPFVPRLIGLAVVSLDMAAGSEASVKLAYLREAEAWQLRDEILHFTPTRDAARRPERPTSGQEQLVGRISTTRLLQAALLEGTFVWAALMVTVVAALAVWATFGATAATGMLPAVVSLVIGLMITVQRQLQTVLRESNFALLRTESGIRISSGLLSTLNRTVELDRVQEVRIVEPWTWRWFNWARVEVDIAGSRATDELAPAATLMPLADRDEATRFVATLLGADLAVAQPVGPGPGARWLDPIGYGYLGVTLLARGAVTRVGRWRRTRVFVPYARVQSVSVHQGFLQRRLGLGTVHLDMPRGVRRWSAPHRDVTESHALVDELVQRARRERATPWSQPPLDPRDTRADHEPQHDPPHQLGPAVEGGPGNVREPGHEERDETERGQGDGQRRGQPDHHEYQDEAGDHQRRQGRQPHQQGTTELG